jgi:hypothetical protein
MDKEGIEYQMTVHLLVSNIAITKKATVKRLDKKVLILVDNESQEEADKLITSIGSVVVP